MCGGGVVLFGRVALAVRGVPCCSFEGLGGGLASGVCVPAAGCRGYDPRGGGVARVAVG